MTDLRDPVEVFAAEIGWEPALERTDLLAEPVAAALRALEAASPEEWRLFIDGAVAERATVLIGSGVRRSKLLVPGALLVALPGAERVDQLGMSPA
ncbi:hypothetical protein BKH31_05480 [Actinomyces oris]|uniref:Uncharacterized protein n=1 Tax=Actinomyces oris TaxID=544580 RepID=A0A1Q8VFX2_9ACTO|nr:hypothetical protein [Actinomyces oris]OLO47008.1 hypothetical protein BKH31_05480 [Actinomyces oris]